MVYRHILMIHEDDEERPTQYSYIDLKAFIPFFVTACNKIAGDETGRMPFSTNAIASGSSNQRASNLKT